MGLIVVRININKKINKKWINKDSRFVLQAQDDQSLGDETPQLGDEPSFLKEAAPKVIIPGHRDTKDVLAQLTASKEDDKSKKQTKHSLYK